MAENKLPSGVGKKIVEALKKQAEIEIQPIPDSVADAGSLIKEPQTSPAENFEEQITDTVSLDDNFVDFSLDDNAPDELGDYMENSFDNDLDSANQSDFDEPFPSSITDNLNFEETDTTMFEEKEMFNPNPAVQPRINGVPPQKNYSMPANVAVLKRLIMQLPQGVTKQTGAQIIRQTMEALGISMNSVLKEAQQGQDSLTTSAKACMAQIQEYRSNIKTLEKQVQDYKKQAVALNDLISLFIMTDRH